MRKPITHSNHKLQKYLYFSEQQINKITEKVLKTFIAYSSTQGFLRNFHKLSEMIGSVIYCASYKITLNNCLRLVNFVKKKINIMFLESQFDMMFHIGIMKFYIAKCQFESLEIFSTFLFRLFSFDNCTCVMT
jgi:hypothetical protein